MLLPKPRVAIHTNYEPDLTIDTNHKILKRGYCISPPYPNPLCAESDSNHFENNMVSAGQYPPSEMVATMQYMHRFEDADFWTIYDSKILSIEGLKRYRRLKYCKKEWDFSIYNMTEY